MKQVQKKEKKKEEKEEGKNEKEEVKKEAKKEDSEFFDLKIHSQWGKFQQKKTAEKNKQANDTTVANTR